jgi:PAS domain-containing protein
MMKERVTTKAELIRLFLQCGVSTIPVVDQNRRIIGFLSKQDIIASSGITSDINISAEKVIEHHINLVDRTKEFSALNLLIQNFSKVDKIPVIDQRGTLVCFWQRSQLISAWEGEKEGGYEELFERLLVGVIITDSSGKIVYLNPTASSMVKGRKRGRNISDVFRVKIGEKPLFEKKRRFSYSSAPIPEGWICVIWSS